MGAMAVPLTAPVAVPEAHPTRKHPERHNREERNEQQKRRKQLQRLAKKEKSATQQHVDELEDASLLTSAVAAAEAAIAAAAVIPQLSNSHPTAIAEPSNSHPSAIQQPSRRTSLPRARPIVQAVQAVAVAKAAVPAHAVRASVAHATTQARPFVLLSK